MPTATLSYTPTRTALWRRTLIRQFWIPRRRWGRLLLGPVLAGTGVVLVSGATPMEISPIGLLGGALTGIGTGWTLWPFLGAWLAVTRSAKVRGRVPVRITVEDGRVEVLRGSDRLLFAAADLERVDRLAGEHWVRFRGDRWVVIPPTAAEGDPTQVLAELQRARQAEPSSAPVLSRSTVTAQPNE